MSLLKPYLGKSKMLMMTMKQVKAKVCCIYLFIYLFIYFVLLVSFDATAMQLNSNYR